MSDKKISSGLSVVIITLNEEAWVGKCMNALAPLDAEIIVVDSGSNDRTIQIAESMGAVVVSHEWQGYAYARNLGAQKARNDWILAIDADEIMSPQLAEEILSTDRRDPETIYQINRLSYIGDTPVRYCGWHPDYVLRLYHRKNASWSGNYVHETLKYSGSNHIKLTNILHHYSYFNKEDHFDRMEKYAMLSAQKLQAEGEKYNLLKVEVKATFRWFRTYILKRGFLDGTLGLYISNMDARSVRMKYKKLKELNMKYN